MASDDSRPVAERPRRSRSTVTNSGDEKRVNGDEGIAEATFPEPMGVEPSSSNVKCRSRNVWLGKLLAWRTVVL